MNTIRILIVCRRFFPAISPRSFRATELAKEFSRQGHKVTVLTPTDSFDYTSFEKEHTLKVENLGNVKFPDININKAGIFNLIRRGVRRILKLLFEYPDIELFFLVKKALLKRSGYNLLISIAVPYPIHWGVAYARRKKNETAGIWIADCGDPYVGRENDTFKVPFYFRYIEKWFMRKADFLTVPTKGAVEGYFQEFHNKIRIIPQGFKFEDYKKQITAKKNKKPTFAYAGMFIPDRRDPRELLDYLLKTDFDYEFHIFTNTKKIIEPQVQAAGEKIIVHDPVPRSELMNFLGEMDFLINFENVGSKQTPSKIIDFIILDKPALSIKTNHLDRAAIDEFLRGDYKRKMVFEDADQYRIENVCNAFLQMAK